MIPKVATNLWHYSAARVAAAVQTSTQTITPSFRTVLQYQTQQAAATTGSTSTASVGWNAAGNATGAASGSGAASAKFDAGGRFYNAYQNSTFDPSAASSQQDEDEKKRTKRTRQTRVKHIPHQSQQLARRNNITSLGPSRLFQAQARLLHTRNQSARERLTDGNAATSNSAASNDAATVSAESTSQAVILSPKSSTRRTYSTSSRPSSPIAPSESAEVIGAKEVSSSASASHLVKGSEVGQATLDLLEEDDPEEFVDLSLSPEELVSSANLSTDPSTPQSVLPPMPSKYRGKHPAMYQIIALVKASVPPTRAQGVRRTPVKEKKELQRLMDEMRADGVRDPLAWSCALWATIRLRLPGESLRPAITLYNDLLSGNIMPRAPKRQRWNAKGKGKDQEAEQQQDVLEYQAGEVIIPSDKVVSLLIRALAIRDAEIASELSALQALNTQTSIRSSSSSNVKNPVERIEELKRENNFAPAMALTNATLQQRYPASLGVVTYNLLLQSALNHTKPMVAESDAEKKVGAEVGGIPSAITIFAHLEKSGCRPSARTFGLLLQIYAAANDLEGAKEVWHEFRSACARSSIDWVITEPQQSTSAPANGFRLTTPWYKRAGTVSADSPLTTPAIRSLISVWSGMIRAHFTCSDPAGGLALLEKMMDAPYATPLPASLSTQPSTSSTKLADSERPMITPVDVPPPASETYYGVVRSFIEAGDSVSALAWFRRLLEQDSVELNIKWDPVIQPPRPDRALWDVMTQSLFESGKVAELNELMDYANSLVNQHFEHVMRKRVEQVKAENPGVEITEKELGVLARTVAKEDVGAYDQRDGHHWALVWRANVAALEAPGIPTEMKQASLDWLRTRIVDTAFFKPNFTTYAITEVPNQSSSSTATSTVDAGEEDLEGLTNNLVYLHSRRFTDNVAQGLRDRAWHAVGLYISQGRIDEGIDLADQLFRKERSEILDAERNEVLEERKRRRQPTAAASTTEEKVEVEENAEWTSELKSGEKTLHALADLRSLVAGLEERIWTYGSESKQYPSLQGLVQHLRLTQTAGLMPAMRPAWYVVNAFLHHRNHPNFLQVVSDRGDWVNLAKTFSATAMSVFYEDNRPAPNPELAWQLVTFVQILKESGRTFDDIGRNNVFRIYKILEHHLGEPELDKLLKGLGPGFVDAHSYFPEHVKRSGAGAAKPTEMEKVNVQASVDAAREQIKSAQPSSPATGSPITPRATNPLNITPAQTVYIHEGTNVGNPQHTGGNVVSPEVGYERLVAGYRMGDVPSPENIARLIISLGHHRQKDKIVKCYEIGNEVLASLENNKSWQASGWSALEDAMVTALAHCGDMKSASLHRGRLVAQGAAPTASAYGALIANIKDTTDNASVAIELFEESRRLGVEPNAYLYNTIISRLAKARKADYAMLLFQNMKTAGLQPTEVTYGAVIAGCARIGDAATAEVLFEEMTSLPTYKPRIPPFNTMMQLYTHVKPNRERALHYYELMQRMGVAPTPYTYKLMLDLYGKNEPVDIKKMDEIIATMKARNIEVSGNHYSSLIIAYGCTMHDLQGALNIFQEIRGTPQIQASMWPMARPSQGRTRLPDVLAYEALLSVLVTHHRIDLMQEYFEQMITKDRVRPTAYIYNLLIKGWASVGDLESARAIFERMVDPAAGAAAPNNHAPHMGHEGVQMVNGTIVGKPEDPVYREPSSWEAMVRAELGAGERGRANALLERMKARFYPAAVTAKVENILWEPSPLSRSDIEDAILAQ